MNNLSLNIKDSPYKDLSVLAFMTFVLFALKAIWAVLISSGPLIHDELLYKFNASAIFALQKYFTAHYPPAYPLALAPALFFKHWYEAMLVLNAFLSSLVVPAAWLLARSTGVLHPLITAVLAALIPLHFVYPNILFSENLFVPLFVVAVTLALRGGKRGAIEALAFGFVLGITHLTKYLFLPALPLLCGAWLYSRSRNMPDASSESRLQRYVPVFLVLASYGVVMGAWLIYGLVSNFSLSQLFGFGISGIQTKAANIDSFLMYAVAYTAYVILAWLPVWGIIVIWTSQLGTQSWQINLESRHWRFIVLALLLLGCYWFVAVQHSFGQNYNYPIPQRMIGRYLMQLSPIMLVVGVWVLERIAENRVPFRKMEASIGVSVLVGLASISWWILFNKGIWAFCEGFANRVAGTVDVIALVSPSVFLLAIGMVLLLLAMICFRSNDIRFLVLPIVVLMLVSLVVDARKMHAMQHGLHFRELAVAGTLLNQQGDTLHVYYEGNANALNLPYFKERMLFWGVKQNQFSVETVSSVKEINCASLSSPALLLTGALLNIKPLREYIVNDKTYYIYRIDGIDPKELRPIVLTSGKDEK